MTDTLVFSLVLVGVLVVLFGILRLRHVSLQSLLLGLGGAILGLLLGALASVPLSKLPAPFGSLMPVAVSVGLTIILMVAVLSRRQTLVHELPFLRPTALAATDDPAAAPAAPAAPVLPPILVDTSAIIDGRIADIAAAGFMPGRLIVPRFVLAELQNIADSDDAMRRGRGRRGLDVLNRLREQADLSVEIIEDDVAGIREVDAKLVALAQKFSCNVLTTDYNLNRVAQIQGVRVLNVNELSNAIRPVVLPGEELLVRVVQPGKERNQGVGYLADGTMIVVENGDRLMGQEVPTEVTRVFQTVAGKMIFAVPTHLIPGMKANPTAVDPTTPEPAVRRPASATVPSPAAPSAPVSRVASESRPAQPHPRGTTDGSVAGQPAAPRSPRPGNHRKRGGYVPATGNIAGNTAAGPQAGGNSRGSRPSSIEDRIIAATNGTAIPDPTPPNPMPDNRAHRPHHN